MDFVGYGVEATDGSLGKVDEKTKDVQGFGFIVVDTGPLIFGKTVMLPAGVIQTVDHDEQKIYLDRTKDEIKSAPEFDEDNFRGDAYQSQLATYYGRGGHTP